MAMKTFCSQIRHKEQDVEKTKWEETEDRDASSSLPVSSCPACNGRYDVVLILPCSHTMCSRCVAAGERTDSAQPLWRRVSLPVCSVVCPACRLPVELPCRTWSAAASCLPKHPTLSPPHVSGEDGACRGHLQHVQGHTQRYTESNEKRKHGCLHGSNTSSSPITPEDGVVDLQEEEMVQSVFGLRFALDASSVPPLLHLSNGSLTVTYRDPPTQFPGDMLRRRKVTSDLWVPLALPQVCADVVITRGQYYWEVDVCNSFMYRIGVTSVDGSSGWWLERHGLSFSAVYDGSWEPLNTVPPHIKSIGVFLNFGGGVLSFHNPVTHEHLATLPTRFSTAGVVPALGLGQGRLRLRCSLPPPPHVFLSKESTYKGPCVPGGSRWHREIHFQSVRDVIQKFEELAVSDSDSGLVSSFGSSSSTMTVPPDLAIPGMFSSGHTGQETGAE